MTETRFAPWLCARCGYMMDAASDVRGDAVPKDGDLSLCLNCCALYELASGKWVTMTLDKRAKLPAAIKLEILQLEIAQRAVIREDLTARDRRA